MSSVPSPALVGRASELRTVIDVITRPPAVVLVEGEAGIGKTRLVRAALGHVPPGDRAVLLGYCHQIREPFPYGPVFEALRDIAGRLPAAGALNPVIGALGDYLPELAGALPPAPPPLNDPRAERHRVFRAIRALLAAVAPAVLVIEDLHWADEGTRDLLRFLIDQPPAGLSLVVTYRREEQSGSSLGRAYRHHPDTTSVVVPLVPLDVTDVGSLAGALLNRSDLSTGFVARLHERTAGIPFVVEEVVRSLADAEEPEALDRAGVPLLLREAMAERMAGLTSAAVRTVQVAAVLRVPAGEQLITAAGGDSAGLGEALRAGVLHEDPGGRYGFRHALAQQAVYDAIPGPERRSAHERVMAALAAMDSPPLVQLAFHARQAGDIEAWLRHGTAAAHRAAALGDNAMAIEIIEDMLDDPDLPPAERAPLALKLSRFARTGLSHQRVVRMLRHVLRDDFLSPEARAEARLDLGLVLSNQAGDTAGGRPEIMTAVEELTHQPSLAARGLACLALPGWGTESLAQHEQWMARAEALVADGDNPELSTAVLVNRASFQAAIGAKDAFAVAETLPVGDSRLAVRREITRGYANLYDSLITLGLFTEAERAAREGRRLAVETGAEYCAYLIDVSSIRMEWLTGRWQGLRERAIAMSDLVAGTPQIAVDVWLVLGMLALATGEWDEAARHFQGAGLDAPDNGYVPIVETAAAGMLELHLARGALDDAVAEVERAILRLRRKAVWVWGAHLIAPAVTALGFAGRLDEAADLVEEYAAGIAGRMAPNAHAALDAAHGALACAGQRHDEAAAHYARAREAYAEMPQPYAAAHAGEGEARSMLARGDSGAGAAFADIAERYGELGATHDAARCRRVLRDIGVEVQLPRGRRAKTSALSQRETEVARLVALGRTNKEIADVLFLSTRTVESHVATVLRKLGVRSRTEVAPPS
ncbi:helix-turn-helix transcriptional regulator [Sphaerisporangium siamense]|uniref:DNA-binding CsgD family transcriptional regulator n=1 Tax=Sphaerisporangium siamense TaxID=795645 RepID=A0A7W7G986_9ACTN|nr:LuxR family transcriptional regulator [Sphaerisporangium siamense]MBB4701032.1 DNA-binding CsgD family transcriptional regulator [Sphaerisporangium siamense]